MNIKKQIKNIAPKPLQFFFTYCYPKTKNSLKILLPKKKQSIAFPNIKKNNYFRIKIFQLLLENAPQNIIIKIKIPSIKHIIKIRGKTSDIPTFSQIFLKQDYNLNYKKNPKLILDGGANVGYASIWFANRFPDANIIAIEPENSNFKMLQLNTKDYENVKPIKAAIWHKKTKLNIKQSNFNWSGNWDFQVEEKQSKNSNYVNYQSKNSNYVNSITINEIIKMSKQNQIDILKLDIEGAEKEVFEYNSNKWLKKTNMIIIELHEEYKKGCIKAFYSAIQKFKFKKSENGENIILKKI